MRGALVVHHLLLQHLVGTHVVLISILVVHDAEFGLTHVGLAKSFFSLRHVADKDFGSVVDMLVRDSMVVPVRCV